jgi:8-oxo-dGTP diphosphatase
MYKDESLLLKFATRGVSKDKWVAPGGKVEKEKGESKEDCIIREVKEETGQKLDKKSLFYHGNVDSIFPEENSIYRIHVFSTGDAIGKLNPKKDEGELKWFPKILLPIDSMWKDYQLWINHAFKQKKFKITAYYKSKRGDVIERADILLNDKIRPSAKLP